MLPFDQAHRPWPAPDRPWLVWMSWRKLAFAHWPVDPARLRPHIPEGLEVETWGGDAWVGVVPFDMLIRGRAMPRFGRQSHLLELNLRTYVTAEGKPGVWFFSLDAERWLAVRAARRFFHLPYFDADMAMELDGETVAYSSERTHPGAPKAGFRARYQPVGGVERPESGSLEHFLTERYCLYAWDGRHIYRSDIHHEPWPLQKGELEIETNTLGDWIGIPLRGAPVLTHYADRNDVVAWLPRPVG